MKMQKILYYLVSGPRISVGQTLTEEGGGVVLFSKFCKK